MAPLKWFMAAVLLLPALELAVFIAIALRIGFLAAVALTLATSLLGLALLKKAGRDDIVRARVAVAEGKLAGADIGGAAIFPMIAGILLFLPGFITDALGLLLLLRPVQRLLHAALGRFMRKARQDQAGVVDLAPGEWNRVEEDGRDRLAG